MYLIGKEEIQAVERVINSRQLFRYRGGENGETDQFESEWSEVIGTKYTTAMSSGTGALICGMAGMGIGPGDEVIVPAYTFMATALAPLSVGAVPILAEINDSLTIDPEDIKLRITPRTKAIMPVHISGLPCDMDAIMQIAKDHNLLVLEDACQADGGSYKGKRLGSIGDAGGFSFNQFKILCCGEGGALVTNNREIFEKALIHHDSGCIFRDHASGIEAPFFAGLNFRITEILSAILRVQLQRLPGILESLRAEKNEIMTALQGCGDFVFCPSYDPAGDCGTTVAMQFDSRETVIALLAKLKDIGITATSPIDSGKHVYTNWEPIMQKHGAHHPKRDAFELASVAVDYTQDMCPRTLSILERTIYLETSAERSKEQLQEFINKIKTVLAG